MQDKQNGNMNMQEIKGFEESNIAETSKRYKAGRIKTEIQNSNKLSKESTAPAAVTGHSQTELK